MLVISQNNKVTHGRLFYERFAQDSGKEIKILTCPNLVIKKKKSYYLKPTVARWRGPRQASNPRLPGNSHVRLTSRPKGRSLGQVARSHDQLEAW